MIVNLMCVEIMGVIKIKSKQYNHQTSKIVCKVMFGVIERWLLSVCLYNVDNSVCVIVMYFY